MFHFKQDECGYMMERLHISAEMLQITWRQIVKEDGKDEEYQLHGQLGRHT